MPRFDRLPRREHKVHLFFAVSLFPAGAFFGEWVNPSGRERTWRLELNPAGSQRESLRISPSIVIAHDKSKQCSHGFLLQHQSPNAFISLCLFVSLLRASVSFWVVFLSLYYIPSIHVSSSYSFFAFVAQRCSSTRTNFLVLSLLNVFLFLWPS